MTTLDPRLDPARPLPGLRVHRLAASHLIEDITNFSAARRDQLIEAINGLDANFIVLDLKAGLDANVIEFLPYSNSGILVFTPQLPAATLAAADIVKAILFRKLRVLFAEGSPVYAELSGLTPAFVNSGCSTGWRTCTTRACTTWTRSWRTCSTRSETTRSSS